MKYLISIFNKFHNAVVVTLAAAVEESILSYEPVITQECEFYFSLTMKCYVISTYNRIAIFVMQLCTNSLI